MSLTESDARESVTIPLADLGCNVPDEATCEVTITATGLDVARNGQTFIVERDGDGYSLTGVVGYDELPARVPDWLEPVVEWFGIAEVQLGR